MPVIPSIVHHRYLICGQHPWALAAYKRIAAVWHSWLTGRLSREWALVYVDAAAPRETAVRTLEDAIFDLMPQYVFVLHWLHEIPDSMVETFEFVSFGSPGPVNITSRRTRLVAQRLTRDGDGERYGLTDWVNIQGEQHDVLMGFVDPVVATMREIVRRTK